MKDSTIKNRELYFTILSSVFLIAIWWLVSIIIGKSYILPSPWVSLKSLIQVVSDASFLPTIVMTLIRVLICVSMSIVVGVLLGLIAGQFKFMEHLLKPLLLITRTLPTIVIIVYVILWMPNTLSPIFVTFLVTFPIVYANTLEGYHQTDLKLIEMAQIYEVHYKKVIQNIYIPSILPYLRSSIIAITSLGLKIVIASEVLSQTPSSIGRSFQMAKINIQTETVFAWALVTIVLSILLDFIMKALFKKGIPYGKTL
ncbi:ABC transporter permease [Fusibacter sp. 3D3]|uniref:ABC transporter permease n=1 Tax=Fusibacter sp. 3D3 TaxID=1048380 RepID=UPI0008534CDD|nr:ABC transporter permease subunit [Fusibacter sp. 3D3]GAU78798.1 ABC-type nitrate/sulfonate/bicarbonate transport system permease component [Fusibacter sp. 3D3]